MSFSSIRLHLGLQKNRTFSFSAGDVLLHVYFIEAVGNGKDCQKLSIRLCQTPGRNIMLWGPASFFANYDTTQPLMALE